MLPWIGGGGEGSNKKKEEKGVRREKDQNRIGGRTHQEEMEDLEM